jgi:hypothetical protein
MVLFWLLEAGGEVPFAAVFCVQSGGYRCSLSKVDFVPSV